MNTNGGFMCGGGGYVFRARRQVGPPTWRRPGMTTAYLLLRRHHPGRGCLLVAMQPVENPARLDDNRIGIDIRLRRVGDHLQIALLRLEHLAVPEEGRA